VLFNPESQLRHRHGRKRLLNATNSCRAETGAEQNFSLPTGSFAAARSGPTVTLQGPHHHLQLGESCCSRLAEERGSASSLLKGRFQGTPVSRARGSRAAGLGRPPPLKFSGCWAAVSRGCVETVSAVSPTRCGACTEQASADRQQRASRRRGASPTPSLPPPAFRHPGS